MSNAGSGLWGAGKSVASGAWGTGRWAGQTVAGLLSAAGGGLADHPYYTLGAVALAGAGLAYKKWGAALQAQTAGVSTAGNTAGTRVGAGSSVAPEGSVAVPAASVATSAPGQ